MVLFPWRSDPSRLEINCPSRAYHPDGGIRFGSRVPDFWDDESLSRLAGFARFLHATLDVCELRSLSAQGGATKLPLGL